MAIQMRRGNEVDFNSDNMLPGEWAVSLDTRYVRMCFSAGQCIRMATYDAFEEDMAQIQAILEECRNIEDAVSAINTQVSANAQAVAEYAESASQSAESASTSAKSASQSANTATTKAGEASTSASNAEESAELAQSYAVGGTASRLGEDTDNAKYYKEKAETASNSASTSASTATQKASEASASAQTASAKATEAEENANRVIEMADASESYAIGGTGTRENEDADNAKYYYEQARLISEGLSGALMPMGTVSFENLPPISEVNDGWMYNISNGFTTTSEFKEGAGNSVAVGANIFKTADGYWDILAGSPVTGVKGSAESSYRRGNVNITKSNVGLGNVDNTSDKDKPISNATQVALDVINDDLTKIENSLSSVTTSDCNEAIEAHVTYYAHIDTLNKPSGANYWIINAIRINDNELWQSAYAITDDIHCKRRFYNGTWYEWEKYAKKSDIDVLTTLKGVEMIAPLSNITDCNNLPIGYTGYTYPSTGNSPGSPCLITTLGLSESYKYQIGVFLGVGTVYSRSFTHSSGWTAWEEHAKKNDVDTLNSNLTPVSLAISDFENANPDIIEIDSIGAVVINNQLHFTDTIFKTLDIRGGGGALFRAIDTRYRPKYRSSRFIAVNTATKECYTLSISPDIASGYWIYTNYQLPVGEYVVIGSYFIN